MDAELLLSEVRRNERSLRAVLFWRDVREVGISLLLVPVWLGMGAALAMPWTWYLTVPALLWIAIFMLVDRWRHRRQVPAPGDPLSQCVECSLAQVAHQIWLLRNVVWWYLLPIGLAILAFFAQTAWQAPAGRGWPGLTFATLAALVIIVFAAIYRLNQYAVRAELEPRQQELTALLASLTHAPPTGGQG